MSQDNDRKQQMIQANVTSVRTMMEKSEMQSELMKALPDMMKKSGFLDKLVRISLTVMRTNPRLGECTQQSLISSIFGCASLGLSPEPVLKQVYFVPFWVRGVGYECALIPGYQGMITLWKRSGEGRNIRAKAVFEGDQFEYSDGLDLILKHTPAQADPGELTAAWCAFTYKDGSKSANVMYKWQLDRIKEKTKSRDRNQNIVGPWIDDYAEMCVKTVIKHGMKLQALSVEDMAKAAAAEDMVVYGGESQKDLFLPKQGPLQIAPTTQEIGERFHEYMGQLSVHPELSGFIAKAAQANEMSEEEIKAEAVTSQEFLTAFNKHLSHMGNEKQKFKKSWFNMTKGDGVKSGFKVWLVENETVVKQWLAKYPDLERDMRAKYGRLYTDAFPYDPPEIPEGSDKDPGAKVPSAASQEVENSENSEMTFDELVQSDLWQEMTLYKDQKPERYKSICETNFQGRDPRTVAEVNIVIDGLTGEGEVTDQGQGPQLEDGDPGPVF